MYIWLLKGQCHDIFDPQFFFHQTFPPRTLINRLKPFLIWFHICRDNQFESVIFTFSSSYIYVMFTYLFVFILVTLWILQSHSFIETTGSDPTVSMTPLNPLLWSHWAYGIMFMSDLGWSHWDRGNRSCSLIETAGNNPAVSFKPREPIPRSHWNQENRSHGLLETLESELINYLEYLVEYEAMWETTLARESRP
jgi:hypothetical protein